MKIIFVMVQVLAGLMSAGGLLILGVIVLLRSSLAFAKEGAGVIGYVVSLFTSGFTKGTPPPEPAGWVAGLPQAGLAALLVAMLVSVFLPGARVYLHGIAAAAVLAAAWLLVLVLTGPRLEVLCLPSLAVWTVYYGLCLSKSG